MTILTSTEDEEESEFEYVKLLLLSTSISERTFEGRKSLSSFCESVKSYILKVNIF